MSAEFAFKGFLNLCYGLCGVGSVCPNAYVTIDVTQSLCPIRFTVGTNAGLVSTRNPNTDYTAIYHELGIQAIRAHDYYSSCD